MSQRKRKIKAKKRVLFLFLIVIFSLIKALKIQYLMGSFSVFKYAIFYQVVIGADADVPERGKTVVILHYENNYRKSYINVVDITVLGFLVRLKSAALWFTRWYNNLEKCRKKHHISPTNYCVRLSGNTIKTFQDYCDSNNNISARRIKSIFDECWKNICIFIDVCS